MRVHTVRELGGLVRDRRERLGLTQQEVADRASVTREWLLRFENGKATVPVSRVLDVLAALDLVVEVSERDA
ncbi:MAG TPA: helix-turn-helix domain-containing protein [Galbitalea sp.]|nr:helix-turn-helix domain-containing protein [Galbitalea sp.]